MPVPNRVSSSPAASVGALTPAGQLMEQLCGIMDALQEIIKQETELVRAGRLREAAVLEKKKSELARLYFAHAAQLKAISNLPKIADQLARRHRDFQMLLQTNLTVLATARAVAEGIIRGVAGELARRTAPKTYGRSGRPPIQAKTVPPISFSRMS